MRLEETIRRRIRRRLGDVELTGDVNASVAANLGEEGAHSTAISVQDADGQADRPAASRDIHPKEERCRRNTGS
jgi:hypothetical protein